MIDIKDYPLFIPPVEVHSKNSMDWTLQDAKIYFDWFMSVKDDRVEYLLTVLDEGIASDNEKDLKRIGQKVFDVLHEEPFSTDESSVKTITNRGLALAADMAFLVAKLIMQKHQEIKWDIVKKPKRDIAYHLPALFEFGRRGHIEPVKPPIVNAKAILRGEETYDIWWRMFKYADDILKNIN